MTGSGDSTVKIWDFSKAECVHTFADHQHAGTFEQLHVSYVMCTHFLVMIVM